MQACREAHKITPITLCELEWSLFARDCERELVPTCRELGIGFLAYRYARAGAQVLSLACHHACCCLPFPASQLTCALRCSPMGKGLLTGQMDLSKLDKNVSPCLLMTCAAS